MILNLFQVHSFYSEGKESYRIYQDFCRKVCAITSVKHCGELITSQLYFHLCHRLNKTRGHLIQFVMFHTIKQSILKQLKIQNRLF